MMGMARLNRPSIFVYGGTIMPGCHKGKDADIVTVFEAVGAEHKTRSVKKKLRRLNVRQSPDRVLAEACIPLILWHQPLKQWV